MGNKTANAAKNAFPNKLIEEKYSGKTMFTKIIKFKLAFWIEMQIFAPVSMFFQVFD